MAYEISEDFPILAFLFNLFILVLIAQFLPPWLFQKSHFLVVIVSGFGGNRHGVADKVRQQIVIDIT